MLTGMALVEAIRNEQSEPPSGIRTLGLDQTHRWIESLERGRIVLNWTVDDRYLNLERAVICSWTTALADQALFFAASSVCTEGEATRMRSLSADFSENMTSGTVRIEASINERTGDQLDGRCLFLVEGRCAATVTAIIDVVRV